MYHYAGNNPIKYTDLDGRDIILLNRSFGANWFHKWGHNAVLIGNDKDGWVYYSKENNSCSNRKYFNTLQDFIDYNSKEIKKDLVYDRAYRIQTSEKEDKIAQAIGDAIILRPYAISEDPEKRWKKGQNCADLVADIITYYKEIKIKKDKSIFKFTYPNAQFESFKIQNPNGSEINILDENENKSNKKKEWKNYGTESN